MKTTGHILHLTTVSPGQTFRAKCSCGTAFATVGGGSLVLTRKEAATVFAAHFDATNEAEQAEQEAQS